MDERNNILLLQIPPSAPENTCDCKVAGVFFFVICVHDADDEPSKVRRAVRERSPVTDPPDRP